MTVGNWIENRYLWVVDAVEDLTLKQIGLIVVGVVGFISSILGIITAFKPDALSGNDSVISYDSIIQSYSDISEFNTFIDEHKGEISYFKIYVVPNSYITHTDTSITLNQHPDCTDDTNREETDWCYSRIYNFEGTNINFDENPNVDFGVKGHFLIPKDSEYDEGMYFFSLTNISDEKIATLPLLQPVLEIRKPEKEKQGAFDRQEIEQLKQETEKLKAEWEKKEQDELLQAEQKRLKLEQQHQVEKDAKENEQALSLPVSTKKVFPSFDCKKATKTTEFVICENSDLAALDIKNMQFYQQAKSYDAITTKKVLKKAIKTKYACGSDVDCIANNYKKSMADFYCISSPSACNLAQ